MFQRPSRALEDDAMIDPKLFYEPALLLHGHKCPGMPLGLRAGAAAMNALGAERARDGELLASVELGDDPCAGCFVDGVQMLTGCTFGKGNIRTVPGGMLGLTLLERATGRAVRVEPRAEVQSSLRQTPFLQECRRKDVPVSRIPDEVVDPIVEQVLGSPQDGILRVGEELRLSCATPIESFDIEPRGAQS
jgi:formylmethanofuran dehydrogenase subunit E